MKPKPFKEEFTLEERAKESASMIASYPARIPIESGLRVNQGSGSNSWSILGGIPSPR
ncbi:Os12g0100050 [Oryza sativa Japonica Group]|uniref:Os12g0100050 protein n=1 Tax=Oryza sativa subsp. japonica TaxID=39947 RepID=C7J9V8_ORYSJ|nr:Os12g0100050 [Oryza sativa Japonica Group]|eukprot:NP_001176742.1 Os12g0100050 [Oryza sativa Japonica Group]